MAIFGAVFGLLMAGMLVLAGFVVWGGVRRRKALDAVAQGMGWSFEPRPTAFRGGFSGYTLFEQGHQQKALSLMRGQSGPYPVEVFDYHYMTGGGGSSHTYTQTVVHVNLDTLRLPGFSVRPDNAVKHLVAAAVGAQDVDLPEHPAFSRQVQLRGPDEAALRAHFSGPVADAFVAHPDLSADGGGAHLFVFRESRLCTPGEIPELVTQAVAIAQAFAGRGA